MNPQGDCSVCTDSSTEENPIYACSNCAIKVHVQCYGIQVDAANFKCNPCISTIAEPQCKLCLKTSVGAFKKTNCGGFVHVVCALWTEGVFFENVKLMEPVDISCVPSSMRNKECSFCLETSGFCPDCSKYKCKKRIHISCAQKESCLKEEEKSDASIKFRAYCLDHKPVKSSRRISSVFVQKKTMVQNREAVEAANKKKDDVEKSAALNSNWILKESNHSKHDEKSKRACEYNENTDDAPPKKIKVDRRRNGTNHKESLYDSIDEQNYMEFAKQNEKEKGKQKQKQKSQQSKVTEISNSNARDSMNEPYSNDVVDNGTLLWDSGDLKTSIVPEIIDFDKDITPLPLIKYHLCYKDEKIAKLKTKYAKLKEKNEKLEELNASLQEQLLCAKQYLQLPSAQVTVSNQEVLKTLKKRIVPSLSEDETQFVFPNGVKVDVKLMKQLQTVPCGATFDRTYINTAFFIMFPEKRLRRQVKKGIPRKDILTKFREADQYQTMKDLFDYRVISDGDGNIQARIRAFALVFRTKLNNWYSTNAVKVATKVNNNIE